VNNLQGFERDAKLLCQRIWAAEVREEVLEVAARNLARKYGIDENTIWDILPEYAEEGRAE